jgi:hypothetical protein
MNSENTSLQVTGSNNVTTLKWFTFNQNNSGGWFDVDDDVDITVIIQASDADEANHLAQKIGIYFNGVSDRRDCRCCGSRWSACYGEGTDLPEIYGVPQSYYTDAKLSRKGLRIYPYTTIE